MNGLTVSMIIPAFRAAGTIRRAVDSALAQTRPPDEIVVVDDGSPDDLPSVLRPYGDRVRLIRKANGGASSARNLGIDQSRGRLIAFLDADDYWEPTKLERQVKVFETYPQVGLCASRFFTQEPGRPRGGPDPKPERFLDRVLTLSGADVFEAATLIWTGTVMVRRDVLGANRFLLGLDTAEDRDMWVRLAGTAAIYLDSAALATVFYEPGSLSRSNLERDCSNMLRVIHAHSGLLGRRGQRRWEIDVYRQWAAGHLGEGDPGAALTPAWKRLLRQPASLEGWWVLIKSAVWVCSPRFWLKAKVSSRPAAPSAGNETPATV